MVDRSALASGGGDGPAGWLARQGVDFATWRAGSRLAWAPAIDAWVAEVGQGLARGYALIIDYGYPAAELYRDHRLEGTIRAYREHTVSDDPFRLIGEQDLTVHVDFTRVVEAGAAAGMTATPVVTQADFLSGAGMGQLLVDLQRDPATEVSEYYRAQAAVMRLIDQEAGPVPGGGNGEERAGGTAPAGFAAQSPASLRLRSNRTRGQISGPTMR